ncbi:MAG: bifunctional ADP-heptose synthase [Candidatus Woesearchaeota archaeon]|jgi:rfaE bifunctional protein kinase chain/domain
MNISKIKKPKIVVLGDVMLDVHKWGVVERISPEAPIPILSVKEIKYTLGGSGNVAANLVKLGAEVTLFGVIGNDYNGQQLQNLLNENNITSHLIQLKDRLTTTKTRFLDMSGAQTGLRADEETTTQLINGYVNEIKTHFLDYDAIIVSDYNKGFMNRDLTNFLKKQNTQIYVDTKKANINLYKNVFLIKPNTKEVKEMTDLEDDLKGAKVLGKKFYANVLLTRAEKGIALFKLNEPAPNLYHADKKEVKDVTGAGDTVLASFVYFISTGKSLEESTKLANKAASIAVSRIGCYQPTLLEILENK